MAGRDYHFDQVLGEATPTEEVYRSSIQGVVHSALEGVNATVLAYGEAVSSYTDAGWPSAAVQCASSELS